MIAPTILKPELEWDIVKQAYHNIGTGFQIVDDITDFEFDLKRNTHNILRAQIYHGEQRDDLENLTSEQIRQGKLIEKYFKEQARIVLGYAYDEVEKGFKKLQGLNFWYDPNHTKSFVNAIAGDQGIERLEKIKES